MTTTGLFIVIDGPSGVGKTTATARVCSDLEQEGWPVHATKEPTQTALGNTARYGTDDYRGLTLACLVAADRYHHLEHEVRPALANGRIVVCDRYLATSLVLQRLDGVDPAFIWGLNRYVNRPDLTIILTGDPARSRQRAEQRGIHSRFHRGGIDAGKVETALYRRVADELAEAGFAVHLHEVGERTPDEVAAALRRTIQSLLASRAAG